jgi:tRNA-dihydrouridine synthase B
MKNFWSNLNKPFYALAPMAGFTDSAFRQICKKFGADLVYSEMASTTALYYSPEETIDLLSFKEHERPYIVQLFGSNPEHFANAARVIEKRIKPDGIDINFGCPVPKVLKQKAGAALMDNIELSRNVIIATIANSSIPVSIKARTGSKNTGLMDFLQKISDLDIKGLMIHGRNIKQGFSGPADYKIAADARKYFKGKIIINGGINDQKSAKEALELSGADGAGIARGALGEPWIFEKLKTQNSKLKSNEEIFKIAIEHSRLAEKLKGKKGIIEMRKHLCWYMRGIAGAKKYKSRLVKVESLDDIIEIFEST